MLFKKHLPQMTISTPKIQNASRSVSQRRTCEIEASPPMIMAAIPTPMITARGGLNCRSAWVPAAIAVVVFFIVYQQIENHVLQPLVYGRTVRLSPLIVLITAAPPPAANFFSLPQMVW